MRNKYIEYINKEVDYYYNKYHFDMNDNGEYNSHNNEGDAFKHTFMQAILNLYTNDFLSKTIGDNHENKPNNNPLEKNMDLWNNRQGRDIAREIKEEHPDWWTYTNREINDIIALKIMIKMYKGELITNPKKPNKKYFQETGFAAPVDTHEIMQNSYDIVSKIFDYPDKILSPDQYIEQKTRKDIINKYYPYHNYDNGIENGHWVTLNGNHVFLKD